MRERIRESVGGGNVVRMGERGERRERRERSERRERMSERAKDRT